MAISIGCAPGTGSSLLRQMLNRHSKIFCGPETRLLAYPELYHQWARFRSALTRRRGVRNPLKSRTWHVISGVDVDDVEFGWSRGALSSLITQSDDFATFCNTFFARPLERFDKQIWAEKSPSNAAFFDLFLRHFPSGSIVHLVRHPYDNIGSLLRRGIPVFEAVAFWLFNNALALRQSKAGGYIRMRYEDLVEDPEDTLSNLLVSWDMEFEPGMLEPGNPHMSTVSKMAGWQYDETEAVGTGGLKRFMSLDLTTQQLIRAACQIIHLDPTFASKHNITLRDCSTLASAFGYQIDHVDTDEHNAQLSKQAKRYYRRRLWHCNTYFWSQKPVAVI